MGSIIKLNRVAGGRELERLRLIFLQAETNIINEIGRLRSRGLVDYHVVASLRRVQDTLRKLTDDCWEYAPRMIEEQFYVRVPEARKIPEPVEKHIRGYANAEALTATQTDIVQRLTMNLMGDITEATTTVMENLQAAVVGRVESDIYRRVGLETVVGMEATGKGVKPAVKDFVEVMRREGITAFTDKAGRNWSLHTYGNMVCRTTSRQAEVLAVITADEGHDLYKISSHGSTCKICAPLEGRVYSKSGNDPDFPPLAAAFGLIDKNGPTTLENSYLNIHPNCLHAIFAWTTAGRSPEAIAEIKRKSSFKTNPPTIDPRTQKQIEAYRRKEVGRRKWLEDFRQWEQYRFTIPDQTPKTFETFQKHKMADSEKYQKWMRAYRTANKEMRA